MYDEKELINKAVKGDEKAFERLIKRYDRKIFNLLLNILKNEADACDAYQDTFIKVHKNLKSFRTESSFYTWLYRIAVNTAYSFYKDRQRLKVNIIENDFSEIEHLHNPGVDDDEENTRERREIVRTEVENLSFQQKSVVYLKSYEGKKFKEIADILSINIGTAKKYFHRAVQNIKGKVD